MAYVKLTSETGLVYVLLSVLWRLERVSRGLIEPRER